MAQDISPKEALARYKQAMGKDLGQVYYELSNQLALLHIKWHQYCTLFGKDRERIRLLNEVAPAFFGYLQRTLFDDILLCLARLIDPRETSVKRQKNLTMNRLTLLIIDSELKRKVEKLLGQVKKKCDFVIEHRHKRLAHLDLKVYRNPHKLPAIDRQKVEEVLKAMRSLMNAIENYYGLGQVVYEESIGALGGADRLCEVLEIFKKLRSATFQDKSLRKYLYNLGIEI